MSRLQRGDRVAVVAPAARLRDDDLSLLDAALELLVDWGLEPLLRLPSNSHRYLAGRDDERAQRLIDTVTDESIRAVFCARGGYGCARIALPLATALDGAQRSSPLPLIGFSDLTFLQLQAHTHWPWLVGVHAPNLATRQLLGDDAHAAMNRLALRQCLFDGVDVPDCALQVLRGDDRCIEAPLIGGCLTLLTSMLGTPWQPDFRGKLVVIEEVGEALYRVDRMLTQLLSAGAFDGTAAILLADFSGCEDRFNQFDALMVELFAEHSMPIARGFPAGHGAINRPFVQGVRCRFDTADGTLIATR
ncbi:LD-carboxypeptidase [Gammaproteobacteria bacterium]|nr:LD-carboxypeptidase [Gammaproteobacteria bacterium]